MPTLTIEELKKRRDEARKGIYLRDGEFRGKITVHMGTCGIAAGSRAIVSAFLEELERHGVRDVQLATSGCAGLCSREPMATLEMRGRPLVKYVDLTPDKARRIFSEHVLKGQIVTEYALGVGSERVG
jgi:NADP-reducing hydrogenase subunit HndB